MRIFEEALRLKQTGKNSAIATIVECRGSSPQKQGAKLLIRDDGSLMGTLGGGCLEAEVVQVALMALRDGIPVTLPFELTERNGGLVCGGSVLVYIEPVMIDPRIIILGAGHIAKALSKLAAITGFSVTVVDDRQEYANSGNIPDAHEFVVRDFDRSLENRPCARDTYIVVATRGHLSDLEALMAALRTPAPYIGLLGSRRKKALLHTMLTERGFANDDIARVITPVGIAIGSVSPEEIAVSILAQIIQQRRNHGSPRGGDRPCGGHFEQIGNAEAAAAARE
jgi:xanthine dehydrogenase accessory factor